MKILPESKVKCVIVDANAPKSFFTYLQNNNIKYVKSAFLQNTVDAVSTHPDMQICKIDSKILIVFFTRLTNYIQILIN